MARTTATNVRQIIETDISDTDIEAYIGSASVFVDSALGGKGLSEALLTEIEKWAAAHFMAASRERQIKTGKGGPAGVTFFGQDGKNFSATTYGQQVLVLDYTGTIANLSEGKIRAKLEAM